jgi:prepilin-type N-terminal cleavage/methylation domain-containing protein
MLNKKGFTLIEVMTALIVLAVSLVGLLGLRNRDIALSQRANHIIEATLLGRQKITELALMKKVSLDGLSCDLRETNPNYQCRWELKPTPFQQVQELVVTVLWNNQGHEETVQFTKYLFQEMDRRT